MPYTFLFSFGCFGLLTPCAESWPRSEVGRADSDGRHDLSGNGLVESRRHGLYGPGGKAGSQRRNVQRRSWRDLTWRCRGTVSAASIRPLTTSPALRKRTPGIAGASLTARTKTGRTSVKEVCGGGARTIGVPDSSNAVSGRSTGGTADATNTPARRSKTKIR